MKFAILTTIDVSMSWFMIPMAYKLKSCGIDVTLMCNMSDEFFDKYSKDFNCVRLDLERGFNLKKTLKTYFFLKKYFKKNRFDAVEYATDNVSFPCSIAAKSRKIPIRILDAWGILFVGFTGFKRILAKIIERTSYRNSTDIRQVSNKNLEFARVNGLAKKKDKIVVLGKGGTIGVDLSKFDVTKKDVFNAEVRSKFNIKKEDFVLGFVGRIQRDKGVNELIEAFKKVYEKNKEIKLMLVGFIDTANPLKSENLSWAKACPNVIFTGRVSDTEKYMSTFNVLVHPTYREGFGMVLQEAAAVKTPIITTDIIGPSEFIISGWNGLLVEPKNADSLYEGICRYIDNYEFAKQCANVCYKYVVENFERNMMINRMVEDRLNLVRNIKC